MMLTKKSSQTQRSWRWKKSVPYSTPSRTQSLGAECSNIWWTDILSRPTARLSCRDSALVSDRAKEEAMMLTDERKEQLLDRLRVLDADTIGVLFPLPPLRSDWRGGRIRFTDEHVRAFSRISGHLGEVIAIAKEVLS